MKSVSVKASSLRRGMAIGIVLMLGLIILVLGLAMITNSGSLLQHTVDAKQRVKSRYVAEGMLAIQTAALMEKASQVFGSDLGLDKVDYISIGTGFGEMAKAEFVTLGSKDKPVQELITTGQFQGLKGLKIPIKIKATALASGGAKTQIEAEIKMYQIPIFQFGVFYENNLEITPGPTMTVGGPVHTNGDAFFRGYEGATLSIQGPVTVSGSIYQWNRGGVLRYLKSPEDTTDYFTVSGLNKTLTLATSDKLPDPDAKGVSNVSQGTAKLKLPIGSAEPIDLIGPKQPTDAPELTRQKFDAKIDCSSGCPNRFIFDPTNPTERPAWISGPRYFWDRREQNWVKLWDFNVRIMAQNTLARRDSIFYLLDTSWQIWGPGPDTVLNAFRIVDGDSLPRNLTVASGNPIYVQGDFNAPQDDGPCAPADKPTPTPDEKYCNAMIAANTVTILSDLWPKLALDSAFGKKNDNGTLEQASTTPWSTSPGVTLGQRPNQAYDAGTKIRIHAAILTGNKPTPLSVLPPAGAIDDAAFEANYEGGWHNTLRFLEDLSEVEFIFRGSFVCIWKAQFPGLRTDDFPRIMGRGFYNPPNRNWGYDPRFANLNNMPPGTPFLSTGVMASWSEPR